MARLRDIIRNEETLLVVCDAVLCEVLPIMRHDAQAVRAEPDLRRFRVRPIVSDQSRTVRITSKHGGKSP